MPSQSREVIQRGESVGKERRKPVRRDPEKRRQQNVQAQKKYREKLRERLDRLEALAASAAQSRAIERTPAAGTDPSPSEAVITHELSGTPAQIVAQSLPAYDASDESICISSAASPAECQDLVSQSDATPSALSMWDFTTYVDPSLLIGDKHNDGLGPYWTTTIDCGCSRPHVQIRTQGPDPFSYGEVKLLSLGPSPPAPDPYANNLRVETVCITSALYTLGMYVGVTEEMLCAYESLSPFFRSSAEAADDIAKADMVCTVQRTFKTLKPDLRPSSEQITVKHHPYIDILPFPTLRKNLIIHQEEIDEDEFFYDMLTGLVCWGGAGIGKRDRADSTGHASTGTPWDVRSWEARVWFLKKYWTLLGGEDGELVRQSEWWRGIRGDDALDMEVQS
ncbi:hypothetical protein MMC17_004072 [Xylographa soralifera]|nr:hypothetical protein [Xylographa soralifera]